MLEHTEGDKELVIEFVVTVPEEWELPTYNIGQRVYWLEDNEEMFGVVMGITYDETIEEWDYEVAKDLRYRRYPDTNDRADYTRWIRAAEIELDQKRVELYRILNTAG